MKRYYVADTWNDGDNNFCYIVEVSTSGIKVYIAYVIEDKYILDDECTEAVQNVVPLIEMFDGAYEIEAKYIYKRIERGCEMPRKKEYDKAVLVRMDEKTYKKLCNIAEAKGITFAEVIRRQIKNAKNTK